MQAPQNLSLEWNPHLSWVSVQSPSQKTALHSKTKSRPKCSVSLFLSFLSTPARSRILILGLPLLSRETFSSPQEHAESLVRAWFQKLV